MHIEVYRPETFAATCVCENVKTRKKSEKAYFPNVCVSKEAHTHTLALRRVSVCVCVCVCVTDSEVIPIKSKGGHFERERKSN